MAQLGSILQQSRGMASHLDHQELPTINLGLEQIEEGSRRLVKRPGVGESKAGEGSGNFFLASLGVPADNLARSVNLLNSGYGGQQDQQIWEPLNPVADGDVEGYLKHAHEQIIISAIEEGRRETLSAFQSHLQSRMEADWNRQKQSIIDELGAYKPAASLEASTSANGSSAASWLAKSGMGSSILGRSVREDKAPQSSVEPAKSMVMHHRMMKYDQVIKTLNLHRREGKSYGLISALAEATKGDSKSALLQPTYNLLASIVKETYVRDGEFQSVPLAERQYARTYFASGQDGSTDREALKRTIVTGGRAFLEQQFDRHVDKTIAAHPTEAQLGGIPGIANKIRGYVDVKFGLGKHKLNLESVGGTYLWAQVYYLLRAGYPDEALKTLQNSLNSLSHHDRLLEGWFKSWLDSQDRRLPKAQRDAFLLQYNTQIRHSAQEGDPFKYALYKIIGRVELNRKSLPSVAPTMEDWLWLQLCLVRESSLVPGAAGADAPHERYTLADLAAMVVKFGEKHFDPNGERPLTYFQVLLLTGQFEMAVAFLHNNRQYSVDAVHFAIALSYYGLLRVPTATQASDVDLLTTEQDPYAAPNTAYLNFARLIQRYVRPFAHSAPQDALQYIYFIALNRDVPAPVGNEQRELCLETIRDLVLSTKSYALLLGSIRADGSSVPGVIERDLKLIGIDSENDFLDKVVKAAADRSSTNQSLGDSILLFYRAKAYERVLEIINKALGASLTLPIQSDASLDALGGAFGGATDLPTLAQNVMRVYETERNPRRRVSEREWETLRMLLELKKAILQAEQGRADFALETIEGLGILPLSDHISIVTQRAEEFKNYPEPIIRNFATVLLTTMGCLYKLYSELRESSYGGVGRQESMNTLRLKARTLLVYAGMLRFRMGTDVYQELSRLDAHF